MKFPSTITVSPTTNGNGFVKGKTYVAQKVNSNYEFKNPSYEVYVGSHKKIINYPDGSVSPHLWNGTDWNLCGKFELVEE